MDPDRRTRPRFSHLTALALSLAVLVPLACVAPQPVAMQAQRYRIEVRMDPATHRLSGRTTLDLVRAGEESVPGGQPVSFELLLHPDLRITRVVTVGADGRYRGPLRKDPVGEADEFAPRRHRVVLKELVDGLTLFVEYEGELFQDVSVGEKPGEIHNFTMRAHIGEEGVYLGSGYWYPEPVADAEEVVPALGDFVLIADPIPGVELVAGAETDPVLSEQTGRLAWRSPYPLDGMVLVGGPHEVHRATHSGVEISVHLRPDQARHADGLIGTVRRNLDRYQPLVGPYPAGEYTVVDNFFSSGFAFPTFTLLSSAVINMGRRAQMRHGMFDHEMMHCWWGNGIHVDPRDGNWCEAITSYATNYYGYVLDGNEDDARRKRRNYVHALSRIKPEDDKPLDTFDREDGAGRGIGYQKGAMVFHMLARKIGQENFWAAMRKLTSEYVGRYANWDDFRHVFEEVGGVSLETFFQQWVRGAGAPKLAIESARYDTARQALTLSLSQGDMAFDLEVPVRVEHAGGHLDILVPLDAPAKEVTVPIDVVPISVELDPDYHVFRKVPLADIIPTTASTRRGSSLVTVLPGGEVTDTFRTLQSIFESSFDEEGDELIVRTVGEIEEGALAERCALILGDAVHDSYVAGFLSAIEFPVRFTEDGFEFDGVTYAEEEHAFVCTVSHPGVPGGGVTALYGNSEAAIPPANFIPMYDRSLVIFKNRMPIYRHDFERRNVIAVDR